MLGLVLRFRRAMTPWLLAAIALVWVACGDDASSPADETGTRLDAIEILPPGNECPSGGIRVEFGIDRNGNGVLDPDEVTETAVVCNGVPGPEGDPGPDGDDGEEGYTGLLDLTPVAPGADCEAGGIEMSVGIDLNRNGALDDDEVAQSAFLCTGIPGLDGLDAVETLQRNDELTLGDEDCPAGGMILNAGLDDGDGGGVAGDGILQDGEIESASILCSAEPLTVIDVDEVETPDGSPGTNLIDASGGELEGAETSGDGGSLDIELNGGSFGGNVELYSTGDISVGGPPGIEYYGGETTVLVTASVDIPVYEGSPIDIDPGTLFMLLGSGQLYRAATPDPPQLVTGLDIAPDVTVTIPVSISAPFPVAQLVLEAGVRNRGTLTAEEGAFAALYDVDHYIGEGGDLTQNETVILALLANRVDNAGRIGATADPDGLGPSTLLVEGRFGFVNRSSGVIAGPGAQTVAVAVQHGDLWNAGRIEAWMGEGGFPNGPIGNAGVALSAGQPTPFAGFDQGFGDVIHTGTIDASGLDGGDCPGGFPGCFAVPGMAVQLVATGGSLVVTGDIDAGGGANDLGAGANGGTITLMAETSSVEGWTIPAGDVEVSADLIVGGGAGSPAGSAGGVVIALDTSAAPNGQSIRLYGYERFDLSGGDGSTGGGGGGVQITNDRAVAFGFPADGGPGGGIYNNVSILTRGGHSLGGEAGGGGDVVFQTDEDFGYIARGEVIVNRATINTRGGDSEWAAGDGGSVVMEAMAGIENTGTLVVRGGDVADLCNINNLAAGVVGIQPCSGRDAGAVDLAADLGELVQDGDILGYGGRATNGYGGNGEGAQLLGRSVSCAGRLLLSGGIGSSGVNGEGGNGGDVWLQSLRGETESTCTFETEGGSGAASGDDGYVQIDGIVVAGERGPR